MTRSGGLPVSVVICTHNRADDAARCIAAVAPQVEALGWELLVVDSASSVEHAQALQQGCARYAVAQYSRVDQAGLSVARNHGAEISRGRWIAYLDDDALAQPDWARRLEMVLARLPAKAAIVGGLIEPLWPPGQDGRHVTPRWLLLLSCVRVPGCGRVVDGFNICGANFAIRRDAFDAVGGFPQGLGRIGTHLISGEESYVIQRLERSGLEAHYDSSFAVLHRIEPERLTQAWISRRAFWEGVTRVFLLRELGESLPPFLWPPKLLASMLVLLGLCWLRRREVDYRIRMQMARGSLWAMLKRSEAGAGSDGLRPKKAPA